MCDGQTTLKKSIYNNSIRDAFTYWILCWQMSFNMSTSEINCFMQLMMSERYDFEHTIFASVLVCRESKTKKKNWMHAYLAHLFSCSRAPSYSVGCSPARFGLGNKHLFVYSAGRWVVLRSKKYELKFIYRSIYLVLLLYIPKRPKEIQLFFWALKVYVLYVIPKKFALMSWGHHFSG